jgi:hypothetical protein
MNAGVLVVVVVDVVVVGIGGVSPSANDIGANAPAVNANATTHAAAIFRRIVSIPLRSLTTQAGRSAVSGIA